MPDLPAFLGKGLPQEYHGGLGFACGALFAVRSPLLSYSPPVRQGVILECGEFSSFATIVSVRDGVVKEQGRRLDVLAKVCFCAILNRLISPWSETKA